MKLIGRVLLRATIATILVSTFMVCTQTFQIFPGYVSSLMGKTAVVPPDVKEIFLNTATNDSIQLWRINHPNQVVPARPLLFFHGNGEFISGRVPLMRAIAGLGFSTYLVEYPGYLSSSGSPTEKGIYAAADAAIAHIAKEANVPASEIVILGHSIGTGPAAYAARQTQAKTLFLVSPYASLTSLVSELPFFGFLSYFLWFEFPSDRYLAELKNTNITVFHAEQDITIPHSNTAILQSAYNGTGKFTVLKNSEADHNMLIHLEEQRLLDALAQLLPDNGSKQSPSDGTVAATY